MAASSIEPRRTGTSPNGQITAARTPRSITRDLTLAYLASLVLAALVAVASAAGLLAPSGL